MLGLCRTFFIAVMLIFIVRPVMAVDNLVIFAAASTKPAFDELQKETNGLTIIYASSASLARQIEYGAKADIYITAHQSWMNNLADLKLIKPGTRQNIARNRLALISSQDIDLQKSLKNLKAALNGQRLTLGDPDFVPAGYYAKQALMNTGQWDDLQGSLAPTKDVTGALMLVARGEVPIGIVYASDVRRSDAIKSFALFPQSNHDPIIYQAAALKGASSSAVRHFFEVLKTSNAFKKAGFEAEP